MDEQEKFLRAISYAIAKGAWVDVSRLDPDKSEVLNDVYLLRTSGSSIIARIPLDELASVPIADIERLREVGPNGLRAIREASGDSSGAKSPAEKAVAWATGMGYPVPSKMGGCLAAILVVIGLCI